MFWRGDARKFLVALMRRKYFIATTVEILEEDREIAADVKKKTGREPMPFLDWIQEIAEMADPLPIKKLSRDPDDNIFVGCTLAAGAKFVVTRDNDLLVLEKPFGIEMIQPREFLRKMA